jgi:hypothetical protein
MRPDGNAPTEQLTRGERLVHLPDVRQSDAYREFPAFRSNMDRLAVRSLLVVPLRKEGALPTVGKFGRFPTSRSLFYKTSPLRR